MPRRRRLPPDTRPPMDVSIYVPPQEYIDKITGQLELIDRSPREVKEVFWERGFEAGFAAFHEWRMNRARGRRGGSSSPLGALFTSPTRSMR